MKTQSVSDQNLENVVKQMVNEALEDNDQVVKFHRMIYEEWYFKKLSGSKDTTHDENEIKPLEENEQDISATVTHRRSRRYKYKRQRSRSSTQIDPTETKTDTKNSEIWRVQSLSRRNEDNSADDKFDVASNNSDKGVDRVIDSKNIQHDTTIIEIWNNSFKQPKQSRNKMKDAIKEVRVHCHPENVKPSKEQRNERRISFEAWKNRKTIEYKQILKKKEHERQQQIIASLENMERRMIAQQEQARKRREQERQRNLKLSKKYLDAIAQANTIVESNQSNFDESEKQKNAKSDQNRKTISTTRRTNNLNTSRKGKINPMKFLEDATFDWWLNQLNWVLHEKYLRERRHLVRSFYCQPIYYGDTSSCVT